MAGGFFGGLFGGNSDTKSEIVSTEVETTEVEATTQCVDSEGKPYEVIEDASLERLSPKLKVRKEMLSDIRSSMAEFESSVNAAKDLSSFSNTGLASAKAMLKDVELDLDSQIRIEGENLLLRNRMSDVEKQLEIKEAELENQRAIADSAQSRLSESQIELQQIKDSVVEYQLADEDNKLVIEQMQKAHGLLENENNLRKQAVDRIESENLSLTESVSQLQSELAVMQETATSREKEANEWKRVNGNTNERLENVQRDLQKLRSSFTEMQRQKIDLESQLNSVQGELTSESKRVADQIRNKDAKIYALESKNEVLEANSRISDQRIDSIKQDNNELQKVASLLDKQVDALKTKVENTRRSHELDREALYKSSDRIAELDLTITSTIAELNQANAERASYADLVEDLNRKNTELSERLIKLSAVEQNHEQLVRAIREKGSTKTSSSRSRNNSDDDDKIVAMKSSKSA